MQQVTVYCDVCKRAKGKGMEQQKWLKVFVTNLDFRIAQAQLPISNIVGGALCNSSYIEKDICSDACLKEELNKFLERIRDTQ